MAYLVAERETNNDPTNFWIFTQPALERMFERAGWEICDFTTIGRKGDSDPVNSDRDERAFYLLRSRALDYSREIQLGDGWYELEQNMWRWTEKSFTVFLPKPSQPPSMAQLSFHFYLPESLMPSRRKLVLNATVNGVALEKQTYSSPGEQTYQQKIPPAALKGDKFDIRFDVEEPFSFSGDDRELGVLVGFTDRCPVLLSFS